MNVLITGSSRGLGRALALEFAAAGYGVVIHGRDNEALANTAQAVALRGTLLEVVEGDVLFSRERIISAAKRIQVDVFVNNAAIYARGSFLEMETAEILDIIATDLTAPILLTHEIGEIMATRGSGIIVNINSTAGRIPNDMEVVYCAVKHGLAGFARSFHCEATRAGVRILDIYIGAMDTAMSEGRDRPKLIRTDEVATVIVSACANYESLQVRELVIGRLIY